MRSARSEDGEESRGRARQATRAPAIAVAALAVVALAGGLIALDEFAERPEPVVAPVGAGPLATRGEQIVDPKGRPVALRGFNVIPIFADLAGQTWEPDHYERMRALGLNSVRFVLYWSELEPERGKLDEGHLATLDTAVARAKAAGLYVVIDAIHLHDGQLYVPEWARTGDNLNDISRHGLRYLTELARRYRDEPAVAAYDPVNEPDPSPLDQGRVMRMYDGIVGAIRSVDRDKLIMVQPAYGDSDLRGGELSLLRRKENVVLSVHDYYAGGSDDGYGADLSQQGDFTWDGATGYARPSVDALEDHLDAYLDPASDAGLPVWIGEFGVNPAATNAATWAREKVGLFRRNGLGYAWWVWRPGDGMEALDPNGQLKPFVARALR